MTQLTVYGEAALHIVAELPVDLIGMPDMLPGEVAFTVGGSAGTVSWQLAELGCAPYFVGVVGDDWMGTYITQDLARRGVNCSGVKRADTSTTRVLELVLADGDRRLLVEPGAGWSPQMFEEMGPQRGVDLDAYIPGFPGYEAAIIALHARGVLLTADLGFIPLLSDRPAMWKHAITLAPYLNTVILSGAGADDGSNRALARACLEAGASVVVTTLGARGALLEAEGLSVHMPAYTVPVRNTLCAGDAFVAGFMAARYEGQALRESVQFGQAVAALKVSRLHTLPTRQDVLTFLQSRGAEL